MTYLLCAPCLERHPKHPDVQPAPAAADCFICQGTLEQLPALAAQALQKAQDIEWSNFSAQTTFPRAMMIREEEVFDGEDIAGATAMKNQVNRIAIDYLEKLGGKPFSVNADIVFKLDFWHQQSLATPAPLFIAGRYLKHTRVYCQHEWACRSCRGRGCKACNFQKQNWPSIEGSLLGVFAPAFGASGGYLHCCGREDVDVQNTGGRPFVLELTAPRKRKQNLGELAAEVAKKHPLALLTLHPCPSWWIEATCVSHFDKHYRAWMEADRPLTDSDWEAVSAYLPLKLKQRTPHRVSERRADLIRERRVYGIKQASAQPGDSVLPAGGWVLDIHAEAGTYIKELIHGDKGRTVPSISSILNTPCRCKQLDVTGFDDAFLETLDRVKEA